MSTEQHNASSVSPCTGIEAPKASAVSPSVVMYWDGGERAITAREKVVIEEHRNSCFSIPLVVVPQGWALIPLQSDEDMRSAGSACIAYATHDNRHRLAAEIWTAMCREAAHVAARAPAPAYNAGGIELTACQLHEALMMAGSPELALPFDDRSQVRIFYNAHGHSGPGLYCECVDVEEEGCILLDGTHAPVARVIEDASVARRAVDLLDQQDTIRVDAEGVNVVPPAAFRADNAHAVGINFVNGEVHGNPDLAEVAPVHGSDVRLEDDAAVTTKYSWSVDEEVFRDQVGSVEEAVAAAVEECGEDLQPGRVVYVGEVTPVGAGQLINADDVIDTMRDRAYDDAGESSEDYLGSVTQAQKDELHALIVAWADRVEEPGFWRVGKVVKHTLTAEDLDHSCEGGGKDCGPVAHYDSEGVPLCQSCHDALLADGQAASEVDRG